MAQIVKLKRSSVAEKVPTTSDLELGELAMNTVDGKVYFEKKGKFSRQYVSIKTA